MTTRLFVGIVIGALFVATITAQQSAKPSQAASHAPRVVPADKHDVSPVLKTLPPGAIATRTKPEMREPGPWRKRNGVKQPHVDTVVQGTPTPLVIPLPSQSTEGLGNVNGVLPPDTNGDVGPNHYVQWVNLSFAVFSKGSSTTPPALVYGPVSGNTLWAGFGGPCESDNNGDPVVLYDRLADRWFMSQLAIPNLLFGIVFGPFYQCIAVSTTPDPAGSYYRYQFQFDNLNDYPKFGLWPDAYYMTMNQYTAINLQFAGQGVVAFDRAKMLAGQQASMVYFDLASVDMHLGGMLPASMTGPPPPAGTPDFFMQFDDDSFGYSPDQLQIWQFHVDWTTPSSSTFTGPATLPTAPFDSDMCGYSRNCIPQPGTTTTVDAISDRLMYRLQYRNFGDHDALVVNHTVDADGTDHAGIRWYEIRNPGTAPTIYQQGTYAPDSDHRWMGSAAMDNAGNIALGFSVSGATTSPSIRYTGRLATDPLGTMSLGEADFAVGAGSQTDATGRWGDYSLMTVDPSDDCTFWYTQEYYAATSDSGWHTRVGSFSFPPCPSSTPSNLPNVSVAATVATAFEAGPVNGTFTVTRNGDTTSALTVAYTIGGTATPGSDYQTLSGTVTIPAGASSADIIVTPIDDLLVEPDETVVLTISPSPTYAVVFPSSATVTIISDDVPPDLVVTAIGVPAAAGAGTTITATDTTANSGTGPSAPSTTGFYLSVNGIIDSTDPLIGTRDVPGLGAAVANSGSATLTIPANTAVGSYVVIAKADVNNTIVETREDNNTRISGTIRIGPDLVVSSLTTPTSADFGSTISVTDTTQNKGGGSAAASTTVFSLSTNTTWHSTDPTIGSRPVGALAPGASDSGTTYLTIPQNTAAGTYYVIAKADGNGVVAETLESNNTRAGVALRIGPDLVVTSVSGPAIAGAGGWISITDTTKNQGASQAGASTTSFYLSANSVLEPGDPWLGSRAVGTLPAGSTSSGMTTVQVPANQATGTYHLIAQADSNNVVAESLETNNTTLGTLIKIGPDLVVSSLTAPATVAAGATINVLDTTKNSGGGGAGASVTQFYLSTNTTVDSSDTPLGSRSVLALAAGLSDSGSTSVVIPANQPAGTYYLIAVADSTNQVLETSETNNVKFVAIKITVGP